MAQAQTDAAVTRVQPMRFRGQIDYDPPSQVIPIGVVVPFDFELDWEYWRYLPPGVELSFTRTPYLRRPVGMALARDVARPNVIARATRALSATDPAVTLYACSSGSFVNGIEGEREVCRIMLEAGARRAVTSSGATLRGLEAIGARRVSIATPYTRAVTERLVAFLEEAGFEVVRAVYLGLSGRISRVDNATIAALIRETHHPDADAMFISCTAMRTFGLISALEEELDLPILTSNQASLWAALAAAKVLPGAVEHTDWVLGGGDPMSRSTIALLQAVGTSEAELAASGTAPPGSRLAAAP